MARRATSSKRKPPVAEEAAAVPPVKPAQAPFDRERRDGEGTEQLLTFLIGDDEYGISILRVREIAEYRPLTPVPMTPPWMRGVMNLRGTVVPVVDLAARLGLERTQVSRRTCLIIVEMDAEGERVVIAVMVDAVSRVVDISRAAIQEPPPFGLGIDFVPGLVRVDERLIVLLDLAAVLSGTEVPGAAALLPSLRATAENGARP
jgi:purine-binding chemotaxis protein CheW